MQAQQDMAEWAFAVFLASVGGIIISSFGLYYVIAAFRLNAEANRQSREFFIAERRAWLNVTPKVTSDHWVLNGNVGSFNVLAEAANTGVSPATNVHFHIPGTGLLTFAGEDLQRFKAEIAKHKSDWSGDATGVTIFPGSPLSMSSNVSIKVLNPEGGDFYIPIFVSYRFPGSSDVHVTPVVFRIGYVSHGGGAVRRISFQTLHHLAPAAD